MSTLIELDGTVHGGGQALRGALTLAGVTGQGFLLHKVRAGQAQPGLRPDQTAEVRAAAMCCEARVSGVFDGSPELRFEPSAPAAGEYHFELPGAASAPLVLQLVVPILAAAEGRSRVEIVGGTHVPHAPPHELVAGPWLAALARLGLRASASLGRVGFQPLGAGQIGAEVDGWTRPSALDLARRGGLRALRGVSADARIKGDVARRQRDSCARKLWEQRRLEVAWAGVDARAESPGSYLYLEAEFEHTRAAFVHLGQRGLSPESLGERIARRLLRFLDHDDAPAVDAHLAEQLVLPLALARGGGRITTPEVSARLEGACELVRLFGLRARVQGRRGGPGLVEVDAC